VSPAARASSMRAIIAVSASGSGQRSGEASASSRGRVQFTGSTATYGGGSMGLFNTRVYQYDNTLIYLPPPWFPTIQDAYTIVLSREVAATAS